MSVWQPPLCGHFSQFRLPRWSLRFGEPLGNARMVMSVISVIRYIGGSLSVLEMSPLVIPVLHADCPL